MPFISCYYYNCHNAMMPHCYHCDTVVEDGAHLEKGEAYCEIEDMKMFMPFKAPEAGTIAVMIPALLLLSLLLPLPILFLLLP